MDIDEDKVALLHSSEYKKKPQYPDKDRTTFILLCYYLFYCYTAIRIQHGSRIKPYFILIHLYRVFMYRAKYLNVNIINIIHL